MFFKNLPYTAKTIKIIIVQDWTVSSKTAWSGLIQCFPTFFSLLPTCLENFLYSPLWAVW